MSLAGSYLVAFAQLRAIIDVLLRILLPLGVAAFVYYLMLR